MKHTICALVLIFAIGCQYTPLVESEDSVSIYLAGEPAIDPAKNSFSIKLKLKSPISSPHLVQLIKFNGTRWNGVESFRMYAGEVFLFWQADHHHGSATDRTMIIMPGEVENVDEALDGFAMLPANWPPGFNEQYTSKHNIQGHVKRALPEHATIYRIQFDGKVLRFSSGHTEYVWPKN
jgi:hypothetical protein